MISLSFSTNVFTYYTYVTIIFSILCDFSFLYQSLQYLINFHTLQYFIILITFSCKFLNYISIYLTSRKNTKIILIQNITQFFNRILVWYSKF